MAKTKMAKKKTVIPKNKKREKKLEIANWKCDICEQMIVYSKSDSHKKNCLRNKKIQEKEIELMNEEAFRRSEELRQAIANKAAKKKKK